MSSSRNSFGDSLRIESRRIEKSLNLLDDPADANDDESGEPEDLVARAETLAREDQKKIGGKRGSKMIGSKREYAQALHRQADIFHHKGDYETALVLYHRAASACPRESSHGIAARRTAAAISSATNPSKALKKLLPRAKNSAQLVANFCPETAAKRAQKIVEESADPVSAIDEILKYFDSRKDFWRDPPILRDRRRSTLISKSKIMLRQLASLASVALENLQAAFAVNDAVTSLRIGNELLVIAEPLTDRFRYEVAARHYLAMSHVNLGRHDRAVDQVTKMIKSARRSADVALRSRSLMTLGRVHLTFRHLDAAARAWERLVKDEEDSVPRAWLLHEIGRCYFEMKRYGEALETSERCLAYAQEANSLKWLMHGKLLSGQSLVELGRLGEAVILFKSARNIAKDQQRSEIYKYISDLTDRLTSTLRQAASYFDHFVETRDKDETIVERKTRSAKSEDRLEFNQSRQLKISNKIHENIFNDSMGKLNILKSHGGNITAKDSRRKKIITRRIDLNKIPPLSRSPIRKSNIFHDAILENDSDSSEISDQVEDDQLTCRTRVMKNETDEDENFHDDYSGIDENFIDEDKPSGGETSNRTGETYVIDELLKFNGNKEDTNIRASRSLIRKSNIFHDAILENDSDSSEILDQVEDDQLTCRTRVMKNETDEDENFHEDYSGINENFIDEDKPSGGEISNRTGETYVIDELLKFNGNKENTNIRASRSLIRKSNIFHDAILENDSDSSEISDQVEDDQLTCRTRVMKNETDEDENFHEDYSGINENFIDEDKPSGGETSNRTGETYVIDELLKFNGNKEDTNIRASRSSTDSEKSDKIVVSHVPDKSNVIEYSKNKKDDKCEISLLRANPHHEEIDENEDEEEEEEETQLLSPNHREILSDCQSKISVATTANTYLIYEKKMADETMKINDDYYYPDGDFSSPRKIDAKEIENFVEKIEDSSMNSQVVISNTRNPENVTNLMKKEFRKKIEEKFDKSSSSRGFDFIDNDKSKNVSQEIRDVVSSTFYLTTSESSSTTLSQAGTNVQNSFLYRHSLPTSPRKEFQPSSLYSHVLYNSDST